MASIDLETKLRQFNYDELRERTKKWLELPSILQLTEDSFKQATAILSPSPKPNGVRGFIDWELKRVPKLVSAGEYKMALNFVANGVNRIGSRFQDDEALSAYFYSRALRGMILEHLAGHGPFKDHMYRPELFLMAAGEYMAADTGVGFVTKYAQRVAECSFGAGIPELGHLALGNLYPGSLIWITGREGVRQLEAMSTDFKVIGKTPFGGKVKIGTVPSAAFDQLIR